MSVERAEKSPDGDLAAGPVQPDAFEDVDESESIENVVQPESFEYSVLRAVPRVERGEFVNVGVVLYCQQLDFLGVAVHVNASRILALDPGCDVEGVAALLDGIAGICEGGARAGQAASEAPGRRFRWLIAPRSTVVQPGPVHTGLTSDPSASLDRLLAAFVC